MVCMKDPSRKGRVFYRLIVSFVKNLRVATDESTDPVAIPITGELDLHTFRPDEVTHLLDDYFAECLKRDIRSVRVIHGKGRGSLRETVHAHLRRSNNVVEFKTCDQASGGWGATRVTLRKIISNE
jgi:DNA-nicking Smr family endonuclease